MNLRKDKVFNEFLSKNYSLVRSIDLLLEVEFPLLFSFTSQNKVYLAYVLSFKRRQKSLEVVVVETNNEELLNLVSKRISIRSVLIKSGLNKTIEISKTHNIMYDLTHDVLEKLPNENFFLEEDLPNTVDLIQKQNIFKNRIQNQSEFEYTKLFNEKIELRSEENEVFSSKIFKKYLTKNTNVEYLEHLGITRLKNNTQIFHEDNFFIPFREDDKTFTKTVFKMFPEVKKIFYNRGENNEY